MTLAQRIGARNGTLVDNTFVRDHFATGAEYAQFVQEYLKGLVKLPRGTGAYLID